MIVTLSDKDCRELLPSATVGRIGFVHDGAVQIIPVNYVVAAAGDIVIRMAPDGVLGSLVDATDPVAFEVDFLDANEGAGWSILMNGSVDVMPEEEASRLDTGRVIPWAGGPRPLYLRFSIDTISGRRVRRVRDAEARLG